MPMFFSTKPKITDCYYAVFVDKPPTQKLNFYETHLLRLTNASINLQKIILPRFY